VKVQVDEQGAVLCELTSADPNLTMEDCPAHQNSTSWALIFSFILVGILGAAGAWLVYSPKEKKQVNERDTTKWDAEEKTVYELVQKHDGGMYQSDILKEVDWSKSKLTRVLDKLEQRDVVERKRRGMTNLVVLK